MQPFDPGQGKNRTRNETKANLYLYKQVGEKADQKWTQGSSLLPQTWEKSVNGPKSISFGYRTGETPNLIYNRSNPNHGFSIQKKTYQHNKV